MSIAQKKIQNQLKDLQNNPITNLTLVSVQDWKWKIKFQATKLSPFYGYPIIAIIQFPEDYPKKAPIFTLQNPQKFFHANLGSSGKICDKILSNQSIIPIRERILQVIQLMGVPNNSSPMNSNAAKLCEESRKKWYKKALKIFRGLEKQ